MQKSVSLKYEPPACTLNSRLAEVHVHASSKKTDEVVEDASSEKTDKPIGAALHPPP